VDRVDIAAVAVQPIEPFEAMMRETLGPIDHRRDHCGGAQGDRAGERHVMLRLADIEGGTHEEARLVARAPGDRFRRDTVGAEEAIRPMLLRRADGDEYGFRFAEVFLDFRPGGEMQLHY